MPGTKPNPSLHLNPAYDFTFSPDPDVYHDPDPDQNPAHKPHLYTGSLVALLLASDAASVEA